ncbi:hypothetical protein DFH09DRAFT_1330393 [Mycena vulgaris]|nr:hypothetical protein DFH09DRAFT_1330393 [Mycena vulgaris]
MSLPNTCTPSQEEWDLHDRQVGAMSYQNVKDPKLRAKVVRVGGHITDLEMNSVIMQSLPSVEFCGSILSLQHFTITFELMNELMSYLEISYRGEVEAAITSRGVDVANVLAVNFGSVTCSNCPVGEHTKEHCWAHGGGCEGQAPCWWAVPSGMEPCQQLIDTAKAARGAKWNTKNTPTAAVAQVSTPVVPIPIHTPAVFTLPMAMYALGMTTDENLDVENQLLPF